jgi:pimeloyl-ACP methyl ester carboxylesterase
MRVLALIVLVAFSGCTRLFLYPDKVKVAEPSLYGVNFSEQVLNDNDGPHLVYWDLAPSGECKGTVLFLHGNAGNISSHIRSVVWLPEHGYRVILFDYRGYGGSSGSATVSGIHRDAERMVRYVADQEPSSQRRILFGQSLGASVALYTANKLARQHPFRAVIADSPFSSYRGIAREKMAEFWLLHPLQWPLGLLFSDDYAPVSNLSELDSPVLLIHGDSDDIVPVHHSAELCSVLAARCTRWVIPESQHIVALNNNRLRNRLIAWLHETSSVIGYKSADGLILLQNGQNGADRAELLVDRPAQSP